MTAAPFKLLCGSMDMSNQNDEVSVRTQVSRMLAEAVAHLGEGILITNDHLEWPGPQIVFVNEAMCRISGYAADELIGQTPRMLQGSESDRATLDRLKGELSAGRECLVELTNYRKDGAAYAAEVFITPLFDDTGRRTNFVSIHRDVSERKRAEEALRVSEERMRAVLNTAADAIVTIDRRGIITGVNPATESMFGYSKGELVGRNVCKLMPSPYREEHDEYLARYLRTGEARIIGIGREAVGRRKDGSTFPIDLAISRVDHLGLFTGIIRDISDRKELQAEVLRVAEEEQRRIGQELHDTVQQELTGLGLLAQNIFEKLASGAVPDVQQAQRVAEGISRTNRTVRMLARGLVAVEVNAQGLASALDELARSTAQLHGLDARFECDAPIELADATTSTQLYRIAQEAINNVVRHSQARDLRIQLVKKGSELTLRVIDDGVGISKTHMDKHGTGLHIMAYRAGLIRGSVQVAPNPSGGTTVTCTVILKDSPD